MFGIPQDFVICFFQYGTFQCGAWYIPGNVRQVVNHGNFPDLITFVVCKLQHNRALRGTGAGLTLVEFCGTGKNSENFSIVNACAGRKQDQIMGLRDGSEVKIWSRAGL